MRYCVILLLLLFFLSATAQIGNTSYQLNENNIDSLKRRLPTAKGTARIDLLNKLASAYGAFQNDSAQACAAQAYREAAFIRYDLGMAWSLRNQACLATDRQELENAKTYARQAIVIAEKVKDREAIAESYTSLGEALVTLNDNEGALQALSASEGAVEKMENKKPLVWIFFLKGKAYAQLNKMYEALRYYNLSTKISKEAGGVSGYADALYGIGRIYAIIKAYPTALFYYKESIACKAAPRGWITYDIYNKVGEIYRILKKYDSAFHYYDLSMAVINAMVKDSLAKKMRLNEVLGYKGKVCFELNEYDKALAVWLPLLESYRSMNDVKHCVALLPAVGQVYERKKEKAKALWYARQTLQMGFQNNLKQGNEAAYGLLVTLFDASGATDSAYHYFQLLTAFRDSAAAAGFNNNIAFYKAIVQNEAGETKIELLSKDNQLKEQKLDFLIIGSVGVFLLCAALVAYFTAKRKNESHKRTLLENRWRIEKLENEKKQAFLHRHAAELEMQALRAQMNPHFIFNCLNAINRFVLKNDTEKAADYLTKFSRLIRVVLQNSSKKTIPLSDELATLQLYTDLEQVRFKNRFRVAVSMDKAIDAEAVAIPPMLLQPFVENAIWHGLMHKEGDGELTIEIARENEALCCTITDNGAGRQNAGAGGMPLDGKRSMGTEITAKRLLILDGEKSEAALTVIDLKDKYGNPCGTKVVVRIPVTLSEPVAFVNQLS